MKQKVQPPAGSPCRARAWTQIKYLPLGLLFILAGAVVGIAILFGEDEETYKQVIGAVLAVGLLALGVYTAFTSLRDALFPGKSRLARSIRSQLPYPDEAPGADQLFAMVDNDLRAGAVRFGPVYIGKEWVLGDDASAISRIRGIFTRDEIRVRTRDGRTQSSRILELILIDDRWQKAVTEFRSPQDLQAAADCLALRAPDARRGVNSQYQDFLSMDDSERESFLREFQNRQNRRASEQAQQASFGGGPQTMILTLPDGSATSRVDAGVVKQQLAQCLNEEEGLFFLTPGRPLQSQGRWFIELECRTGNWHPDTGREAEVVLLLKEAPPQPGQPPVRGFRRKTDPKQGEELLLCWLRGEVPELRFWAPVELEQPWQPPQPREAPPPRLILISAGGAAQGHDTFTAEDIQVAAEGLVDGTYKKVDLTLPGGYLWIQAEAGDKSDGRCTVKATRADRDKLRFFTARCTHRQAAAWITAYAAGQFRPGGGEWKDYTRQVEKDRK